MFLIVTDKNNTLWNVLYVVKGSIVTFFDISYVNNLMVCIKREIAFCYPHLLYCG